MLTLCPCCCVCVCLSLSFDPAPPMCVTCGCVHVWSCMNAYPVVSICAVFARLPRSPACAYLCACLSQPPIEGRPPLLIRDLHRDWQFRRHDLRSQHQRLELLRGRRPELGWWWWRWRLRLRRRSWSRASQEARRRDARWYLWTSPSGPAGVRLKRCCSWGWIVQSVQICEENWKFENFPSKHREVRTRLNEHRTKVESFYLTESGNIHMWGEMCE